MTSSSDCQNQLQQLECRDIEIQSRKKQLQLLLEDFGRPLGEEVREILDHFLQPSNEPDVTLRDVVQELRSDLTREKGGIISEDTLGAREESVMVREHSVTTRETSVMAREKNVVALRENSEGRERSIAVREQDVATLQEKLVVMQKEITLREENMTGLEEVLADRERMMKIREENLAAQEKSLVSKLVAKDKGFRIHDQSLKARERILEAREKMLETKEEYLEVKEESFVAREQDARNQHFRLTRWQAELEQMEKQRMETRAGQRAERDVLDWKIREFEVKEQRIRKREEELMAKDKQLHIDRNDVHRWRARLHEAAMWLREEEKKICEERNKLLEVEMEMGAERKLNTPHNKSDLPMTEGHRREQGQENSSDKLQQDKQPVDIKTGLQLPAEDPWARAVEIEARLRSPEEPSRVESPGSAQILGQAKQFSVNADTVYMEIDWVTNRTAGVIALGGINAA
ncbi:hypothetical protein D9757_007458 [Collybiopsis confluens]|uniref:Uncharacterized protein n=1 Tax=Collybiopsis confluens TaxID=2823264 RepID=A0A8H5HJZ9_9AGAR|nr:hypothetical protein D9757_007458 [Collybiopsis confluens]